MTKPDLSHIPSSGSLLQNVMALSRDPFGSLQSWAETVGPVVRVDLPPGSHLLVSDPADIKHVLQEAHRNFERLGSGTTTLSLVLGNALPASTGPHWLKQRRLAQPAFSKAHIAEYSKHVVRRTEQMLDRIPAQVANGKPLSVFPMLSKLALAVVGDAMFSEELEGEFSNLADPLAYLIDDGFKRVLLPVPLSLPLPRNFRFKSELKKARAIADRMIKARRSSGIHRPDFLSAFTDARDPETGASMSHDEILDEIFAMLIAGHETTAALITFAFAFLSRNPAVARRLRGELDEVLGGRAPTMADFSRLPYMKQVLEETLRLRPSVWLIERTATAEETLSGLRVPKGTQIWVSPFVTQRHVKYWDNPYAFDPERFNREESGGRHPMAHFPFGAGPHQCIGAGFATMEATIVLAMTLQRFHFDLVQAESLHPAFGFTLRPVGDAPMRVRERRPTGTVSTAGADSP